MVLYNFKKIASVPTAEEFVDIILSVTQRRTPTIIHRNLPIIRVRQFYMRKVKFTAQNFRDRITRILEEFPILDEIHPFYADLCNVLYDRDHYKLALGQINTARHLIDNLAKDYVRLLKFGDSLYLCKCLKRAALGRMCTIVKRQKASLAYLEEVRQHMARLPSIDPTTRTILLTGYPNVGKSSFMNSVTRADVEVEPYAFTTKSLFVGHMDFKYLRWQVIDTPGILDHPLEERNTIEMLAITALAHLRATILFVVDISTECGYSISQQIALFNSINPLFANKPLIIACNKIDVLELDSLAEEDKAQLQALEAEGVQLMPMSTLAERGVTEVKEMCCERLLAQRVEHKLKSTKRDDITARLHVAQPVKRDRMERKPHIPASVLRGKRSENMITEKARGKKSGSRLIDDPNNNMWLQADEDPDWDPTVFGPDFRSEYLLKDEDWNFDSIPEFLDGINIADWVDPDILDKLMLLEIEEEGRAEEEDAFNRANPEFTISEDDLQAIKELKSKRQLAKIEHEIKKNSSSGGFVPRKPRSAANFEEHLRGLGIEPEQVSVPVRSRSRSRGLKRDRSASAERRSRSRTPHEEGLRDEAQRKEANKKRRASTKRMEKNARRGESDRHIYDMKPKHLYSGKRGIGKTDRR